MLFDRTRRANGSVTDRFEYDSFGESLSYTGTSDTPFRFNGCYGVQTDANGLLYMRRCFSEIRLDNRMRPRWLAVQFIIIMLRLCWLRPMGQTAVAD
jgi:hypothetical protein